MSLMKICLVPLLNLEASSLSEPIDTHQHRSCYHAEYPWGEAPIATYQFKYRTHSKQLGKHVFGSTR